MVPVDVFVNGMRTPAQTGVLENVKAAEGHAPAVIVFEINNDESVLGGEAFTKPLIRVSRKERINDLCFIEICLKSP